MTPAYLALRNTGELTRRAENAVARLRACDLCPRRCGVDRTRSANGACRTGALTRVSSIGPHFGEEAPLVGRSGSGTIFFAGCNLKCQFCQNYEISHFNEGVEAVADVLADMMLKLQARGCHNINFVTPTHVVPQILTALDIAAERGLTVPLVYNSGGYDSIETLQLLDGVFDIYMPDMKYADADIARRYSEAKDYPTVNRAAVKEMHRQVGELQIDDRGIATRGLLVRHLVLPNGLAGTREIARFLATEISKETYINVMAQYHPCYRARELPPLDRPITRAEFADAVRAAQEEGLHRFDRLL